MLSRNIGNQNFDGMHLKKYLSAYGQKVFSTLINWKSERNRNIRSFSEVNPSRPSHHHQRIITLNDRIQPQQQTLEYQQNVTSHSIEENAVDIVPAVPPTNVELLESTIDLSIIDTSYNLLNKSNVLEDNLKCDEPLKNTEDDRSKQVDWNNFIDSELFPEFIVNENEKKDNDNVALFKLNFPNDNEITNFQNENIMKEKCIKRKTTVKNSDKNKKFKIETDVRLDKKNSYRKKKYTTTVKNWLNDVNCGSVNDVSLVEDAVLNNNDKFGEIIIEKTITKNNKKKKTIQAQLTNKDGVMKYTKPSKSDVIEKPMEKAVKSIPNITTGKENVNNNEVEIDINEVFKKSPIKQKDDKVKERNIKSKFVAPIKSQIPVKDITYDVNVVNGSNIDECKRRLEEYNHDLVLTLVYGNGFSQLNSQHTDDNSASEGLMLFFDNIYYYFKGNDKSFIDVLNEILNRNLIIYDAKNVLIYLISSFDIPIGELNLNIFDIKIGASLIEPDNPPESFSEVQKLVSFRPEYTVATACALQKCAWYLRSLALCADCVRAALVERELWKLFVDIEMQVLPIIAVMEHRGICADIKKLKSMESVLLERMKATELECHRAAGKSFQVTSAVQVRTILYDELQLDAKCNVKIRETICQGAKSTSETMLRSLVCEHPLPRLILEHRRLHKAHATFLAGIVPHVTNGIVRPTWIQTAAATGRIACCNPNLQAIPKTPFSLALYPQEEQNAETLKFRSVYTPRAGHTLLAADFKHVECRVFAHQAADTSLLAALASPDLFRELAAKWLNKPAASVSEEERERTKRIVYASLYGAGSRKLMEILDVSYDHALSIVASFNRTFPSLKSFGRWVVSRCAQSGGRVRTASGRTRTFHNIASADFAARSHAERQAVNFVVQGLAADICKLAMVRTARRLRMAGVGEWPCAPLLQIHDELVWELPHQHVGTAAGIIKSTMEQCGREFGISVPLPVALYRGASWGDLLEMTPEQIYQES